VRPAASLLLQFADLIPDCNVRAEKVAARAEKVAAKVSRSSLFAIDASIVGRRFGCSPDMQRRDM
jgi:hypothetical protein